MIVCLAIALAMLLCLATALESPVPHHHHHRRRLIADHLNLLSDGGYTMLSTEKLPLSISPTAETPDGPVSAPVTSVVFSVDPAAGVVNVVTDDGLNAEFVPVAGFVGDVTVSVTAKNVKGDDLTDSVSFSVTAPVAVADKLNLKAGDPVAAA